MKKSILLAATLLIAGANLTLPAAEPAARPNILFIITDQQFAEAMSNRMGDQFLKTPALDRLASRGRLFTRSYSANPICMPARNSIFTGRYPHETQITGNKNPPGGVLDPVEFKNMGNYFAEAGYQTAYFGKWHLCFDIKNKASHGFATIDQLGMHDPDVAATAVDFINTKPTKPFLLVTSFLNPHDICEFARRIAGKTQVLRAGGEIGPTPPLAELPPLPANFIPGENEPDGLSVIRQAYQVPTGLFPVANFSEQDWREQRWAYFRLIEKVDAEIGKVLAALDATGQADNTLIVFTSDHGECAGAHGFNQKTVFYEESARVPLIVSLPGQTQAGTSDQLVNVGIDLLPTMLDFAGLEIPKKLPGRSLRRLVAGQTVPDWRDYVVVENDLDQAGTINGLKPRLQGRMVRTARYKYSIYDHGNLRESLVDLQTDPGERMNLATDATHHAVLLQHRALLAQFGHDHHDSLAATLLADGVKPIPFPKNQPAP